MLAMVHQVRRARLSFVTMAVPNYSIVGVSNTAGAALWAIDYALQAASRSVRVMNFHDGIGYRYNLVSTRLERIIR